MDNLEPIPPGIKKHYIVMARQRLWRLREVWHRTSGLTRSEILVIAMLADVSAIDQYYGKEEYIGNTIPKRATP